VEGESMIKVKSIFSKVSDDDGFRVLVEPVWPQKANREQTVLDVWFRELAPSPGLYSRYVHNQLPWEEFVVRYHSELDRCHGYFRDLQAYNHEGGLTIMHGSRDQERNIAMAVKMFMEKNDHPPDPLVNPIRYLTEPLDLNIETDKVRV
jgi:uncharacterized protein YeaO (DUF488 family)